MTDRRKAIAFDVDAASLASLREALAGWEIEVTSGASTGSLDRDWAPGAADLLVVGGREEVADALGLCRGLRSQAGRAHTLLVVLVPPGQRMLVGAALEAGAGSCLLLPIHPKQVTSLLAHARAGNQPGRHTLNLDRPQQEDPWQDEGGES